MTANDDKEEKDGDDDDDGLTVAVACMWWCHDVTVRVYGDSGGDRER